MQTSSSANPDLSDEICALCGQRSLCGGLGYVRYDLPVEHPQFGKLFRCPNAPADPKRVDRLRRLGNLDAFADKTLANFRIDLPGLTPTQAKSLQTALSTAQAYADQPDGWLLLEGTYGCGKTHLAAAVGNARLQSEVSVLFITTPDLLDHLRSTYGADSEAGYDEMFDRLRNAPLLILDDLGVENPSGWAQEKLFQLLNHRYSNLLPTVITTNADIDMLDPRIRSRLLDDTIIHRVHISAPDYRTPIPTQGNQVSTLTMYADMRFESFDTTTALSAAQHEHLQRAVNAAHTYAEAREGWFLLKGDYGTGKTHLAAAIGNFWQDMGLEVLFVTVPDLLDYLRQTYSPASSTTFDRRFHEVRNAPLLILDDLGTESATAWAKEKLFQILNHRYITPMPTVITTSLATDKIDPRILSRLLDQRRCKAFEIMVKSYAERIYRK